MPVHDWARVDAAIFHAFHHGWITALARALNGGLLPSAYYALPAYGERPKQGVSGVGPDFLYATNAKAVTIRRVSNHQVVAKGEIVSPGHKNSQTGLNVFVRNVRETRAAGISLLLVDLFPPSSRDPQGIHRAVWGEDCGTDYVLPDGKPLTCVAYVGGAGAEAFVEFVAVGDALPEMPLFLTPEVYVSVPLEGTYQLAWENMPAYWRDVLTIPPG